MKQQLRHRLPYLLTEALTFWALPPLLFLLLPDNWRDFSSVILIFFFAVPLVLLCANVIEGAVHGFHWICPLATAVLFVPTVFFNLSYVVYLLAYTALSAGFLLLGSVFFRLRKKQNS